MPQTAFCGVDENNVYTGHSDKFEQGLFIAPIPELKENSKAIWTGRSWKIVKTNMDLSSSVTSAPDTELNKKTYLIDDQLEIKLSSHDNSDNNFFLDKFTTEKKLLDVEIIKLIENNQKVPTEWSDYSDKLFTYIQYLENHLVFMDRCEEEIYSEQSLSEVNDYRKTNFSLIGDFLKTIVVFDTEKAKELCYEQSDFELMKKYSDFYISNKGQALKSDQTIVYNTKDHRIVNLSLDNKIIEKNIEEGVFRKILVSELLPITDREPSIESGISSLSTLSHENDNEIEVPEEQFYYDAFPDIFERLDLHKLCVRYYEYYDEKYKAPEPLIEENDEPESLEIVAAHQKATRNSRLKSNWFRECFVRFSFRKDDYQEALERYQKLTGKTTFTTSESGIQHDLVKLLSDEVLLVDIMPSYVLELSDSELNAMESIEIKFDYARVFQGYQDIFDLIDSVKVEQNIIDIDELEKEQAKIPEGMQPHMLKGPATLYETDLK